MLKNVKAAKLARSPMPNVMNTATRASTVKAMTKLKKNVLVELPLRIQRIYGADRRAARANGSTASNESALSVL